MNAATKEYLAKRGIPLVISYYLVGILFMLFDLEVLLLYPFAVTMSDLTLRGNNDFRWSSNNGICRGNCFTSTLLNNVQHQFREHHDDLTSVDASDTQ